MKIIHPQLVMVEEEDDLMMICQWLLQHTAVKYNQFDPSVWVKQPKPGDLIICGQTPYAVMRWGYDILEKGDEDTLENKFKATYALLVSLYGEEEAGHVIAKLARRASSDNTIDIQEMAKLHASSTWGQSDVPTKE